MSTVLPQLESDLSDQPHNPLRPEQRKDWEEEKNRLAGMVSAPDWAGADKGGARRRYQELSKLLTAQTPKPIEDAERANRVKENADRILKDEIVPALLPKVVMRRNPAGAVDEFNRRENSPTVKRKILAWKRAMWALDPDTTDRDHTNIERFRPEGNPMQGSSFMADAQIPGVFGMTNQAKANWPLGDPTIDTALKQVQRQREAAAKARDAKAMKRAERVAQEAAGG